MNSPTSPAWIHPVPNILTFLRLALAFVLPFVPAPYLLATIAIAASTDALDGWIARRFHATTELGRLLDGVADKAFALAVVVTLALQRIIEPWQGALILTRDLVVTVLAVRLALTHRWEGFRHMRVRWAGKLTTLLAFLWFATLLLPVSSGWRLATFYAAAAASLWAAADYLNQAARLRRDATSPAD